MRARNCGIRLSIILAICLMGTFANSATAEKRSEAKTGSKTTLQEHPPTDKKNKIEMLPGETDELGKLKALLAADEALIAKQKALIDELNKEVAKCHK